MAVMRMCIATIAAVLIAGECVVGPETREGRLEVIATDLTGNPIDGAQAELFPGESRVAAITTTSGKTTVPFGDYRVRIYKPGFAAQWRFVRIAQSETALRAELPVGTIAGCPESTTIAGKVDVDGSQGDVWVKVIPLRGTGGGESRVGPNGFFAVSGLERSTYVVLVLQGELVLHHRIVKTYPVGTDTSKLSIKIR